MKSHTVGRSRLGLLAGAGMSVSLLSFLLVRSGAPLPIGRDPHVEYLSAATDSPKLGAAVLLDASLPSNATPAETPAHPATLGEAGEAARVPEAPASPAQSNPGLSGSTLDSIWAEIGSRTDVEILAFLRRAVENGDGSLVAFASDLVLGRATAGAIGERVVETFLDAEDPAFAAVLVQILEERVAASTPDFLAKVEDALVEVLEQDGSTGRREAALHYFLTVAATNPLSEATLARLEVLEATHADGKVRATALWLLSPARDPATAEAALMAALTRDPDPIVRTTAAQGLRHFPPTRLADDLAGPIAASYRGESDLGVRRALFELATVRGFESPSVGLAFLDTLAEIETDAALRAAIGVATGA